MKRYLCISVTLITLLIPSAAEAADFQAGAAAVDISPRTLPAIRNGGFLQATSERVDDPLHARCLVLADGNETIAIAIVDSCMFPTDVCDAIKLGVEKRCGIPTNRILVSATHTHTAPSVMSYCLGTGRDESYTEFVVPRVVSGIVAAFENLQPAKIGWTSVSVPELTNCRRWITRKDRVGKDPFGARTVRAMMHPGYLNPDYVCPAGPIDPELSVISVVTVDKDRPLCILANYSMHYFGGGAGFSADYFGEVAAALESKFTHEDADFVGIMSQGTSGDLHWMNYARPKRPLSRSEYATQVCQQISLAQQQIQHRRDVTLAMAESRFRLNRRLPDSERLAWAKPINEQRGDQPPRNQVEVYAQQAAWIDQNRDAEVVLQAVRIGELAITAMPNEVYGITGLKLKQQSPLPNTFNLELANGAEGYIPPPEQHRFGGYTTWPARSAGLEEQAEPKIVEAVLSLLEAVTEKPRRPYVDPENDVSRVVMKANPTLFWRLGDMVADRATDQTGKHPAEYHGRVAMHLQGPASEPFAGSANRAVYFAGGHLKANVDDLPNEYTASFWFWNGLPAEAGRNLGTLFARYRRCRREVVDCSGRFGHGDFVVSIRFANSFWLDATGIQGLASCRGRQNRSQGHRFPRRRSESRN